MFTTFSIYLHHDSTKQLHWKEKLIHFKRLHKVFGFRQILFPYLAITIWILGHVQRTQHTTTCSSLSKSNLSTCDTNSYVLPNLGGELQGLGSPIRLSVLSMWLDGHYLLAQLIIDVLHCAVPGILLCLESEQHPLQYEKYAGKPHFSYHFEGQLWETIWMQCHWQKQVSPKPLVANLGHLFLRHEIVLI